MLAFYIVGGLLLVYLFVYGAYVHYSEKFEEASQKKKGFMYGLFYKLENGTVLFIVKAWRQTGMKETRQYIIERKSGVESIFNRDHFEKQYGEKFNPNSLFIKPVGETEIPQPRYSRLTVVTK